MKFTALFLLISFSAFAIRPDSDFGETLTYNIWDYGAGARSFDIYTYKKDLQSVPYFQMIQENGMDCYFSSIILSNNGDDSSVSSTYDKWRVTISYSGADKKDSCWIYMQHPDYTKVLPIQFIVID